MGLGLDLTGHHEAAPGDEETWLDRVRWWLEEHAGEPLESVRLDRDGPAVLINLHPCAEDVEVRVRGPGRVAVSAKTSTVGPGYHAHLCDLLHRMGDAMGIAWDEPGAGDETGYFHTGGARALEGEFLRWLGGVVAAVADGLSRDYQWMMISMAVGHHYRHHGPLVTPLGPRDRGWLEAVAEDPARGIDVFPWWAPGLGAGFYRGRALARMWRDVRWRAPLDEAEGRLLMDVHLDLARAHRLDPALEYPWAEWRELMDHIEAYFGYVEMAGDDVEAEVRRRAAPVATEAPPIGYRRRPVRVDLTDGWSIEIPGEMAEDWDEDGLWTARDDGRAVFFRSYRLSKDDGSPPTTGEILEGLTLPEGPRVEHRREGLIGRAALVAPDGGDEPAWRLAGHSVVDGGLAICNVIVRDPDDRDWAVATWRSLEHA